MNVFILMKSRMYVLYRDEKWNLLSLPVFDIISTEIIAKIYPPKIRKFLMEALEIKPFVADVDSIFTLFRIIMNILKNIIRNKNIPYHLLNVFNVTRCTKISIKWHIIMNRLTRKINKKFEVLAGNLTIHYNRSNIILKWIMQLIYKNAWSESSYFPLRWKRCIM